MSEAATPGGIPQAEFIVSVLPPSNSRRFALRAGRALLQLKSQPQVDDMISVSMNGTTAAPEHAGGREKISPWLGNQEWVDERVGGGEGMVWLALRPLPGGPPSDEHRARY
jgi:hypothetical protein